MQHLAPIPSEFIIKRPSGGGGRQASSLVTETVDIVGNARVGRNMASRILNFIGTGFFNGHNTPPAEMTQISVLVLKPKGRWWKPVENANDGFMSKEMTFTVEKRRRQSGRYEYTLMSNKEKIDLARYLYPDAINANNFSNLYTNVRNSPLQIALGYSIHGKLLCLPTDCVLTAPMYGATPNSKRKIQRKIVDMFMLINQMSSPNATVVQLMKANEVVSPGERTKKKMTIPPTVKNAIFSAQNFAIQTGRVRRRANTSPPRAGNAGRTRLT